MFYTPERASQVLMVPYGASTMAIVVQKKNTDEDQGTRVALFGQSLSASNWAPWIWKDARRRPARTITEGRQARRSIVHTVQCYHADVICGHLAAGQVDGAFIGTEQAFWYRKKGQDFFRIALTGYDPHAEALAFKDPALSRCRCGRHERTLHADGTFEQDLSRSRMAIAYCQGLTRSRLARCRRRSAHRRLGDPIGGRDTTAPICIAQHGAGILGAEQPAPPL